MSNFCLLTLTISFSDYSDYYILIQHTKLSTTVYIWVSLVIVPTLGKFDGDHTDLDWPMDLANLSSFFAWEIKILFRAGYNQHTYGKKLMKRFLENNAPLLRKLNFPMPVTKMGSYLAIFINQLWFTSKINVIFGISIKNWVEWHIFQRETFFIEHTSVLPLSSFFQ